MSKKYSETGSGKGWKDSKIESIYDDTILVSVAYNHLINDLYTIARWLININESDHFQIAEQHHSYHLTY